MTKEEKEWDSDEVFRLIRMEVRLKKRIEYLKQRIASAEHGVKIHSPIHQELVKHWKKELQELQEILGEENDSSK